VVMVHYYYRKGPMNFGTRIMDGMT